MRAIINRAKLFLFMDLFLLAVCQNGCSQIETSHVCVLRTGRSGICVKGYRLQQGRRLERDRYSRHEKSYKHGGVAAIVQSFVISLAPSLFLLREIPKK